MYSTRNDLPEATRVKVIDPPKGDGREGLTGTVLNVDAGYGA